jgi:uncharacterized protein
MRKVSTESTIISIFGNFRSSDSLHVLYQLQTLDLAITQHRNRLAEIAATLGKDEAVAAARGSLENAEKALKPWQNKTRDLDLEIKGIVQKIQAADQRLYSGKVSNPKELRDLQEEIESLKRRQSQLEDDLLEAMIQVEERQAVSQDAQQALNRAQAAWTHDQGDLLVEQQRLQNELAQLELRRKQGAATIDSKLITIYETIRTKKRGQAVALLKGDSCTTCGVEQTSVIAQRVRQGSEIVYCASCGRILVPGGA